MSVTHYADADENGITFVETPAADVPGYIAPVPPLCRQGNDGDMMTFFWTETTCRNCLLLGDPRG